MLILSYLAPAFEHKIKRAAVRDGLNLISVALNMIMAGTGEINCLRRLRYAFGLYHLPVRYGTHVSIHMSLGLLFLGGGRYTLGTSDAAIAALVTAFFPRFKCPLCLLADRKPVPLQLRQYNTVSSPCVVASMPAGSCPRPACLSCLQFCHFLTMHMKLCSRS